MRRRVRPGHGVPGDAVAPDAGGGGAGRRGGARGVARPHQPHLRHALAPLDPGERVCVCARARACVPLCVGACVRACSCAENRSKDKKTGISAIMMTKGAVVAIMHGTLLSLMIRYYHG